jgi:DNA-binding transcriptional LysR family regulator
MSASDILDGLKDLPVRGRRKRGSPFLILATVLLIFAAVVGACFLILRPTTLRIAVGPSGSDDQNLVQALAQTFARDGSSVRLSLVTTAGPVDSIAALAAGKADLAVGRTDEEMPDGTESVAILRKNVVVFWAPTRLRALRKAVRFGRPTEVSPFQNRSGFDRPDAN